MWIYNEIKRYFSWKNVCVFNHISPELCSTSLLKYILSWFGIPSNCTEDWLALHSHVLTNENLIVIWLKLFKNDVKIKSCNFAKNLHELWLWIRLKRCIKIYIHISNLFREERKGNNVMNMFQMIQMCTDESPVLLWKKVIAEVERSFIVKDPIGVSGSRVTWPRTLDWLKSQRELVREKNVVAQTNT